MYENPIQGTLGEIQTKIIEAQENYIMQVVQDCGVTVDKEELTRALMYDRQQYEKGYADAKAEMRWIPVSERLPEEDVYVLLCDGEDDESYDSGAYSRIAVGWLEDGMFRCWDDRTHMSEIVAWMPMPKPYKGETE